MKTILAFSGSNSSTSINQQFVTFAANLVTQANVEIISLRDYETPMFSVDIERESGIPANMQQLAQKIMDADGVILSSPEYNSMIPPVLKNTLDWMSRIGRKLPWSDTHVLLLSTSPGGRGGLTNLTNLAAVMPHWGASIVATHAQGKFYDHVTDGVPDDEVTAILREKVQALEAAIA